ncbi:bifunctional phosphoribosylaminoimidazolecarboxamide formyltransferase/IMP cyclohydrolase [Aquibacillus sp. 3ASR75-11]|uniref:Bifunctional purine biosynthesis protein PurH n=1 Tax=Terrihalobacillus insolitus TaxID=2950438 RepID=A0A9X3WWG4_9BACI|nr:bifunctional phosphoribosylaminoimidazolecarboxamide formyltransferase/IMP cyclohydrolase [Terrihalobacillus insolitus]MDC3414195.1 bifunctional phosphoribosylaminoimidazolecarboxamide formyltransferase/IMP cyclohydrolase [Terrihalobacillus insolitus]MDC3425401.1 bifunctional phosphoribosylaminoimidazolecarboxamide formyltransferase/IMP cyclohydrolase [Terrihalobacillus insolitus]
MKKRALISVSDKRNVVDFAKELNNLGYEIISTGGTLKTLRDAGLPAIPVSDVTKFDEILDGRVKTLHPSIHAGLLAKRENTQHLEQLQSQDITPIDLVVVNLYPFKQTIEKEGVTETDAIENIDIGGPTMLRSAAKNFYDVTVIVDPNDYAEIVSQLKENKLDIATKKRLAAKVFRHTAHYDAMISQYFLTLTGEKDPETLTFSYEKVQSLRYGENPHQQAAFYKEPVVHDASLANAEQLHGKELSFNNIQDANAALEIVLEFNQAAAVAVKHMNPCGVGIGSSISDAYRKAYEADPISIFGGIVALNREVDLQTAEQLKDIFLEIVIAPSFSEQALELLTQKKNIRLLKISMDQGESSSNQKVVSVAGGVLVQDKDKGTVTNDDLTIPTKRHPNEQELTDLLFAWKVVKHVKSNAIVIAKKDRTLGVGAGQMNRVGAAKIALDQAFDQTNGAVMASDAFFPMPDTVEEAAKAGITAIIQPGGSKRDDDSVKACDEHGIAMVFTGLRHFKH